MMELLIKTFFIAVISANIILAGEEMKFKEIEKLNREELINLSVKEIKERYTTFNPNVYDRIKAMRSKNHIYVHFDLSIKYVYSDRELYYDATVNYSKDGKSVDLSTSITPHGTSEDTSNVWSHNFFSPTGESDSALVFVLNAMYENNAGLENKKEISDQVNITVFDNDTCFIVEEYCQSGKGWFSVRKSDGKIYNRGHKQLHYKYIEEQEKEREKYKEVKYFFTS